MCQIWMASGLSPLRTRQYEYQWNAHRWKWRRETKPQKPEELMKWESSVRSGRRGAGIHPAGGSSERHLSSCAVRSAPDAADGAELNPSLCPRLSEETLCICRICSHPPTDSTSWLLLVFKKKQRPPQCLESVMCSRGAARVPLRGTNYNARLPDCAGVISTPSLCRTLPSSVTLCHSSYIQYCITALLT